MELFDYYLRYMTELLAGKRPAPAGITLTAEDEEGRTRQISEQLSAMGAADFVRACAERTAKAGLPMREGVEFEPLLGLLTPSVEK